MAGKKAFQIVVHLNHHSVTEMADEIRNVIRTIIDPDGSVRPIPDIRSGLLELTDPVYKKPGNKEWENLK